MLRQVTDTLGLLPVNARSQLEAAAGAPISQEYWDFLERYNGGRPEPEAFPVKWQGQDWAGRFPYDGVHFLFGFEEGGPSDLIANLRHYRGRIPDDTIPVGMDPGGNLLLLGITGPNANKVFLWVQDYEVDEGEQPDYSNVGLIANSFNEFLQALHD